MDGKNAGGMCPGFRLDVARGIASCCGEAVALQVVPAEFLLQAGDSITFQARSLDKQGLVVEDASVDKVEAWIPPTAKVKSKLEGTVDGATLQVDEEAGFSAGAFRISSGELMGTSRGRSVPAMPYVEDFEGFELAEAESACLLAVLV